VLSRNDSPITKESMSVFQWIEKLKCGMDEENKVMRGPHKTTKGKKEALKKKQSRVVKEDSFPRSTRRVGKKESLGAYRQIWWREGLMNKRAEKVWGGLGRRGPTPRN